MGYADLWRGDQLAETGMIMAQLFSTLQLDADNQRGLEAVVRHIKIPDDYLLLDVETLGYGKQTPIAQVGWGVVKNRQLVNVESLLLNWLLPEYGQRPDWVRSQILRITEDMAKKGKRYCTTAERMLSEGLDPLDVMDSYRKLINMYVDTGGMTVGHNFWAFDRVRIDHHCRQFFDTTIRWLPNSIFDTGLVEKAAQSNRLPFPEETLDVYYQRINGGFSRIKWNLEDHCVTKYQLAERYGVDPSLAHDAGHDCRLTYCLFETYREITESMYGRT